MIITRRQLRRLIKEELGSLYEIPGYIKRAAARKGIPHMGSAPGPKRSLEANHPGWGDLDKDGIRDFADADHDGDGVDDTYADVESGPIDHWDPKGQEFLGDLEKGEVDEEKMRVVWPSLSSDFHAEIATHEVQKGHPLYDVVLDLYKKSQEKWLSGHGL